MVSTVMRFEWFIEGACGGSSKGMKFGGSLIAGNGG
jgi:hypothetical protein